MRCAAIHRKLGTHISKVKSLSMDSWSNEQVDNMRKVGNVVSNQIYNPENKRPPVPVDADEADSAMERFIRQKYMNNVVTSKSSGKPYTPSSDEGVPPPLPPKNSSSKFGLRSASSLFPLTSRLKKDKALPNPDHHRRPASHGSSKPSKVFGAAVNYDNGDEMERKLARLQDMGFQDNQRNSIVLKGVNGNLERAIESLVRLGEGDRRSSQAPAPPPRDSSSRVSRSLTPLSSDTPGSAAGLSLPEKPARDLPATPSSGSTNPWDNMTAAPPQTAQSTGTLHTNNPYNQSLNPFGAPSQQPDAFSQAFQRLNLQAPQQPLFPNRTGGLTPQNPNPPAFLQIAPSAPTTPQNYQPTPPQSYQQMSYHSMTHPQPQLPPHKTGYNPFFTNQGGFFQQQQHQQQAFQQQPNIMLNTQQSQQSFSHNPFQRSPIRIGSPTTLGQIPEQSQTMYQSAPLQSMTTGTNPFYASPAQSPTHMGQQAFAQQQAYTQQQYAQPQRHDKASIMALYNNMTTTPHAPTSPPATQPLQRSTIPENYVMQTQQQVQPAQPTPQSNTNNPFMKGGTAAATDPFATGRHVSRESVMLGKDMAWNNGRHSPDAFANLSARHV